MEANRTAVLGLFRSGSTAVAGVLHRLGVQMGEPFWRDYYESESIGLELRTWWNEPFLEETVPQSQRIEALKRWVEEQERRGEPVGLKHPLLSLCGEDLQAAWGSSTRFIWSCRALEDSVRSLENKKWWPNARFVQERLWAAVTRFCAGQDHLRIEFAELINDSRREVHRIAEYLNLHPSEQQVKQAIRFVKPKKSKFTSGSSRKAA